MTQHIVIKNLEELGRFADLIVPPEPPSNERALVPVVVEPVVEPDLGELAEVASRAAKELRDLAAADAEARQQAEEALARYRRLEDDSARLERAAGEVEAVVRRATVIWRSVSLRDATSWRTR
jgi:chromosome segregation ATPase